MNRSLLVRSTALLLSVCTYALCGQEGLHAGRPLWISLSCQATTTKNINLGDSPSSNSESIRIIRHNNFLDVAVNGEEFKKSFGDASLATDTYRINGFGARSISATQTVTPDSIVHTLIIDNKGEQAMWTETGYSWMAPYQPFGSMVLLTCKKIKGK